MADILQTIIAERREEVELAKRIIPAEVLRERAKGRVRRSLAQSLAAAGGTRIIAEMKKASPSAGLLCADYRPGRLAIAYAEAGAAGLSVLTEPRHFLGQGGHLHEARRAVDLPILRKDFMCDAYQVYEADAWGADVILLIGAALEPGLMRELYDTAIECGLEVLAEAHTAKEVDVALSLEQAIVGVNSRDLKTLKTDLATARALVSRIPPERLSVAESGIRTRAEIVELEALGYRGFLVGETLMRGGDPAAALRDLLGASDA